MNKTFPKRTSSSLFDAQGYVRV